ncbi:TonB-dependent receptor domain-containing protein, partial [Bordetella bronchiseptica]|uniref:TonB-dependent receptor domain-containing protein n=1 Tax=Bordetella bronchiseptica TaxID=518 RepID=UPI002FDB2922
TSATRSRCSTATSRSATCSSKGRYRLYEFREGWLHGADAGAALNYVGERAGDSSDSGFELPAYTTVDLLAHYPLASNATLGVNVNN